MTRPAILLDLDGTLVDSLPDIAASANQVRQHFDLPPLELQAVRAMIGDGAAKLVERALADLPQTAPRPAPALAGLKLFRADYARRCTDQVAPYPGVIEVLEHWHAAGIGLAVVTNKPEKFAVDIVAALGLDRFCKVVIGGDSTPEHKPSPVPLRAALARLGRRAPGPAAGSSRPAPRQLAWMIGDGEPDLRAGRAAGLHTVAVTYGYGDLARLREIGADAFWDHFQAGPLPGLDDD